MLFVLAKTLTGPMLDLLLYSSFTPGVDTYDVLK
jgi:hypothetical protein